MTIQHDETAVEVPVSGGAIDYEKLAAGMNEAQLRNLVRSLGAEVTGLRRVGALVGELGRYLDARDKLLAWRAAHPGQPAPKELTHAYLAASARFQEARRAAG